MTSAGGAASRDRRPDDAAAARPHPPDTISVILCVHNGGPYLTEQLESLARQHFDGIWELIVVDDRSTDDTVATAMSWADRIPLRVVTIEEGAGLSNARNVGIAAASGDVLLFCDADDVADENWLAAMAAAGRRSSIFGGHLDQSTLNPASTERWRYPFTPGSLPLVFGRWRSPVGANMGIRAELMRAIGEFDTTLPTGEEVDVAIRAQLLGHRPVYVPDAVIHYRYRPGLRALAKQSYRYGLGNAELFARYRAVGVRSRPLRALAGTAGRLVRGAPGAALDRRRRGSWVRYASYTAGQLVGGLRNRDLWIG